MFDNPFSMVVGIVAIISIAGVLRAKYGAHRHWRGPHAGADDAEATRLREEVRTLKERVAVLERLATDHTSSLDREIERLRSGDNV